MLYDGYPNRLREHGPVTTRAPPSVSVDALERVTDVVRRLASEWSVEEAEDYDGHVLLLVSRTDECAHDSSYVLSGGAGRIEVSELRDDTLQQIGDFGTLDEAVAALLKALSTYNG